MRDEQGLLPADWAQQLGHMHLVHALRAGMGNVSELTQGQTHVFTASIACVDP